MERLNNDVLALIIEIEPQLGLACRRFWNILEHQSRSRAYRDLGAIELLDAFHDDCKSIMGLESWGATAYLSKFDIWFFDPQHIIGLQDGDIREIASADDIDDLMQGVWRRVHGQRWGTSLHASNVPWLHLKYQTKLQPGRYKVCVNLRVGNFAGLYPIKFSCVGPQVTQLGSIYPTVHLDTNNNHPDCIYEYNQYLQFRSCELCIGLIDVADDPKLQSWPHITFKIEDQHPSSKRGILFNYLYFERVPITFPANDFWGLNRKTFWPTPEWVQLFDRHTKRKFAQF